MTAPSAKLAELCNKHPTYKAKTCPGCADDASPSLITKGELAALRADASGDALPIMFIHPLDIGRYATGTLTRESEEQIALYAHLASQPSAGAEQTGIGVYFDEPTNGIALDPHTLEAAAKWCDDARTEAGRHFAKGIRALASGRI